MCVCVCVCVCVCMNARTGGEWLPGRSGWGREASRVGGCVNTRVIVPLLRSFVSFHQFLPGGGGGGGDCKNVARPPSSASLESCE